MAISDITKPMALDETLQATNGKMDSVITKLQGIIDALGLDTSVYKPKGNITCAALVPALLIESNIGNVYNVTDNGTTTSDFVEGAGKPIHVGDNVAIVDVGTGGQSEYKFDLLAGMVDLTNYVQKSQTAGLLKNDGTVDETEYATADDLEGVSDDVDAIEERMDADTTSISGNPISISGLKSNQLAVNPIITLEPIQAGSGTPSPSNIRAISGYDKIEVLSCGKNLLSIDDVYMTGKTSSLWYNFLGQEASILDNATKVSLYAGTYYIKLNNASGTSRLQVIRMVGGEPDVLVDSATEGSFTLSKDDIVYLRINASASTISFKPMLELGSSASAYQPYHKTTDLSESLGQTVYGLTHEVRTGKARVTIGAYLNLGDFDWLKQDATGVFYTRYHNELIAYSISGDLGVKCTQYPTIDTTSGISALTNADYGIVASSSRFDTGKTIAIKDKDKTSMTATEFKAAMNGVMMVYTLDNPYEIQLTPHEISLLSNYAYVSTNGTNIALDYHNGELASLADVSQLGETVNELGDVLKTEIKAIVETYNVGSSTLKISAVAGSLIMLARSSAGVKGMYLVDSTGEPVAMITASGSITVVKDGSQIAITNSSGVAVRISIIRPSTP